MAKLVYIPTINRNTWLHLTRKGQSTCLRDFSREPRPAPTRAYKWTEIQELLELSGSHEVKPPPHHEHTEVPYWQNIVRMFNGDPNFPAPPDDPFDNDEDAGNPTRLPLLLRDEADVLIQNRDVVGLARLFEEWIPKARCNQGHFKV